ncbi:hypothetical protein CALVIDRAFT_553632 [Calocera viscosa TUFC12733]|uniref:GmrSD restriction endonucleases N-terminal domain-containing protein n=1 Tax=Calocera viscosa (strain TUFC12733) TaxID=1330018 RepID=A0A167PHY6_CALVF|nr:hypothetical protein CALVIDRAFT_553632 [Calocera viscosa TUFC12733]
MEALGRIPKKPGVLPSHPGSRPQTYSNAVADSRQYPSTSSSIDPRQRPSTSTSADPRQRPSTSTAPPAAHRPRPPAPPAPEPRVSDEEEAQVLQEILADDDDDDEEDEPSGSGPSRRRGREDDGIKRNYGTLNLTHKLPDYDAIRMTASDLHALIHEGFIDLDPEYQRDVVWPEKKQQMLIDSMLNNFYIPAVIFSVRRVWDETKGMEVEQRVCMDGKQRLTSMVRFMDGLIPYVHSNGIKYWYQLPFGQNSKRNQQLPDRLKREFAQKAISCIQYQDIEEDNEREIFRRVQLGVALSPAEKLQGVTSPFAEFVRQLQKQYVDGEKTLGDSINWQKKRGVDFACVAQILCCLYNLPNFVWPGQTNLEKFLRKKEVPTKSFKLEVLQIFAEYVSLARDNRYNFGFRDIADRVSPVELVMIGLLIGYMKDADASEKAYHIRMLRKSTREQFKDIRANNVVTKFMWSYIKSIKVAKTYVPSKSEASGSRKRKNREDAEEFRPHPSRR